MKLLKAGRAYQLRGDEYGHGIYAGRRHWLVIEEDQLVTRIGLRVVDTVPRTTKAPTDYAHAYTVLSELEGRGRTWSEEVELAQAEAMELVGRAAAAALEQTLTAHAEAVTEILPVLAAPVTAPASAASADRPCVRSFDA